MIQSVPFPAQDPFPLTALNSSIEARILVDRQVDVSLGVQVYVQEQTLPAPSTVAGPSSPAGSGWNAARSATLA